MSTPNAYETMDPVAIDGPLVYAHPEGKVLRLNLYRPAVEPRQARPAVVLIHGGGWFGGMRQQLRWYGRQFASRGFVAVAIDYRRMFRWAFPFCLHDAKSAVRWLRIHAAEYGIDTGRIVALGNSAGGHLSCLLATTRPEHGLEGTENLGPSSAVQAAVSLYGPQDLAYYLEPEWPLKVVSPVSAWYISHFVGRDLKGADNPLAAASPLTYVDRGTAPIFFIHGTNDWLAPHQQSQHLYERLRALGVYTDFMSIEGRNHAFDFIFWEERARCFERILAFLEVALDGRRAGNCI